MNGHEIGMEAFSATSPLAYNLVNQENDQMTKVRDMNSRKEQIRYETRAKILKALAHPSRLKLIDKLAEQEEVCVCELTDTIGSDMSTVSRHLGQLRAAGIVESEKRGQMVFYRLRVKCLKSLFACIESVVQCNVEEGQMVLS